MRRRRRRSALVAGLLAVALAGGGMWSIFALSGNDIVEAAVTQAKSLSDLLGARSPGERTEALLTKTKLARPLAKERLAAAPHPPKPHLVATPKVAMTDIARLLEAPPPVVGAVAPAPFAQEAMITPAPSVGAIVAPPGGSGGGSPSGPSTPSSFPGPESKQPIVVPSAVPEPGTWATMLLGFGLIGWRIRRRQAAQPKALQA